MKGTTDIMVTTDMLDAASALEETLPYDSIMSVFDQQQIEGPCPHSWVAHDRYARQLNELLQIENLTRRDLIRMAIRCLSEMKHFSRNDDGGGKDEIAYDYFIFYLTLARAARA